MDYEWLRSDLSSSISEAYSVYLDFLSDDGEQTLDF